MDEYNFVLCLQYVFSMILCLKVLFFSAFLTMSLYHLVGFVVNCLSFCEKSCMF